MKKFLLYVFAVLAFTFMANAQNNREFRSMSDTHIDSYVTNSGSLRGNAPAPSSTVNYSFEGSLEGWTTIDADGDGYDWALSTDTPPGHNASTGCVFSHSYINDVGPVNPNNYLVSPTKAAYSQVTFYACAQDAGYPAEHFGVAVSTGSNTNAADFTTIKEWTMTAKGTGLPTKGRDGQTRAEGTWYECTADLSAYAGQEIWVAIRHFNCTDQFILKVDDITLTTGEGPTPPTPPTGDVVVKLTAPDLWGDGSGYQMLLDNTHSLYGTTIPESGPLSTNCSGNEAIYAQFSHKIPVNADGNCTTSNVVCNNTVEITIPAGTYDWCIANPTPGDRIWIASSNGTIPGRYDDYVFEAGKTYEFTLSMYGTNDGVDVTISGETPPTPPTEGTYDFEDGTMQGWTTIDADGDGNVWVSSANPGVYHTQGVNLAGSGHNSSDGFVLSGSYAKQLNQALTPDNYLVSPNKIAAQNGASIKFYACAQDANYASEHFGVAVSTTGNTSGNDFTTIQEWTMTAKGTGVSSQGRDGQTRAQGAWYEYTADLSAYAGQEIWVAIRHFNCTDQFILNVDDITLTDYDAVPEQEANMLSVYPNPAYDKVVFTSEALVNEYRIYNIAGSEIMSNVVNAETFEVNVSDMPAGIYVIRIYGDGIIQSKKFVVK